MQLLSGRVPGQCASCVRGQQPVTAAPVQPVRRSIVARALEGGPAASSLAAATSLAAALQESEAGAAIVSAVNEIPPEVTSSFAIGGVQAGVAVAGLAGIVGLATWALTADRDSAPARKQEGSMSEQKAGSAPPPPPRENAVMVLGASGRIGARVVSRLLKAGRTVVAVSRTADNARTAAAAAGFQEGYQAGGAPGILFCEEADVTSVDSLKRPDLWRGVNQVVVTLAGKFGPLPGGGFGPIDGLTTEVVEAGGVANLISVLPEVLAKRTSVEFKDASPMSNPEEIAEWARMDDVIMGGNSASAIQHAPDVGPRVARWKGELILEGGGFCGARQKLRTPLDLSAYDGVSLRVKGDGSIFKLNIKTTDQLDMPESTYQATFDTVDGQWHDVFLPWHNFVPVKRAQSDPDGPALDPTKIGSFGLVLSRFEFNKMPNPAYKPGPFELLIDGGIRAFKAVRPQLVHLSSAGVERNAIIGDDIERRKKDIPIVQLNPGGTLNHKYSAELAVRASGYPYVVVRSTGMIDSQEGGPFLIEADQGDTISGTMGRDEVADVLAYVSSTPEATGKTFEVRRNEALDGRGREMTGDDYNRMLLKLASDRHRWRVGLRPFPKYVPPPAEVTEERRKEIVEEVQRVRDVQKEALEAKTGAAKSEPSKEPVTAAAAAVRS